MPAAVSGSVAVGSSPAKIWACKAAISASVETGAEANSGTAPKELSGMGSAKLVSVIIVPSVR